LLGSLTLLAQHQARSGAFHGSAGARFGCARSVISWWCTLAQLMAKNKKKSFGGLISRVRCEV
jgi:hypothetical protein